MNRNLLAICMWSVVLFFVSELFSPRTLVIQRGRQLENITKPFKNSTTTTSTYPIPWLSSYIKWHNDTRSDPALVADAQYLIVDQGAGGLGDRLKHLPYYMWLASKYNRVLLIYWDKDCHIEEYFQPNSINWTTPKYVLDQAVHLNKKNDNVDYFNHLIGDSDMEAHRVDKVLQVFGNHLSLTRGIPRVVEESGNNRRVFRYIFKSLFRLSDPVQKLLDKTKQEIGLGDDYIGVHLRARYPGISKILAAAGDNVDAKGITNVTSEVKQELLKMSSHAIDCTRKALGGDNSNNAQQVYFASDTLLAMELQQEKDKRVVYLKTNEERVHFSQGNSQCNQYYPAIVDLWLLSEAKCIGFGAGGYGAVATMMSNFDCWTLHQWNSMLSQQFKKETNFFNGKDGALPECLLPPSKSSKL
jgi:hypothetical protein